MLADQNRSWERVGIFAAGCCQTRSLNLDPWQTMPLRASLADLDKPRDDPRGERRAAELLRRLLDSNLSRFELFPLRPLEQAEQRQAAK